MATTVERKDKPLPIQKKGIPPRVLYWHIAGLINVGILILVLTYMNFFPIVTAPAAPTQDVKMPPYDLAAYRELVVQQAARLKPFETAAQELCREIHGRNKVLGQDPVAVVLSWMLDGHPKDFDRISEIWDEKEFILCEHEDVRRFIFLLQKDGTLKPDDLEHEQVHAKYMSPRQLREFVETFVHLKQTRRGKLRELTSHLPDNELGAVEHRLSLYEAIRNPGEAEKKFLKHETRTRDPLGIVALDPVPGAPWFSIGELRVIHQDPDQWFQVMKERVKDAPQLYLNQEHQAALSVFQQKVLAGQGQAAVQELREVLADHREKSVAEYKRLRDEGEEKKATDLLGKELALWASLDEDMKKRNDTLMMLAKALERPDLDVEEVAPALEEFLDDRDQALVKMLVDRLPRKPGEYLPTKQQYRMLHLNYLELRFPDLYQTAVYDRPPPSGGIKQVLASYDALSQAYDTNDPAQFAKATDNFFATLKQVSEKETNAVYPGSDTMMDRLGHLIHGENTDAPSPQLISLELTFNQVKPFMWAWILMLGSLLFFCLSLGLNSRLFYIAGFSAYAVSLAFQVFGFFTRIVISGRPPVTNMYETVIWVAFMTGIFALILEGIYRRKVIALAGAFVATIGLVLADQLPLALDPRITSLVPVLRSNFWLTVHVITIVSSYAGGALAWGLANIALVLIVFGHPNKDTIKMLSNFTYRAIQIAVLLLATGTFLGGWWAAYSWGRFWGWDPKETGALIALVAYVIPLHMRYIGWIKDFGLAVAAIICFAFILFSWYGINFVVPAGLHAYAFGGGGAGWVYWAGLINIQWVLVASLIYQYKKLNPPAPAGA